MAQAEIHTYDSPTLVYSMNWSVSGCAQKPSCSTDRHAPAAASTAARGMRPAPPPSAIAAWRPLQVRPDKPFRLAVGSYVEDLNNRVEIISRERGSGEAVGGCGLVNCRRRAAWGCMLPALPRRGA